MIGDRAATPSPIDFSTDVEVKNKFGAATTKQNLSVTKGASIEDAVQKFCELHEVKPADCRPLETGVVTYLKKQSGSNTSSGSGGPTVL